MSYKFNIFHIPLKQKQKQKYTKPILKHKDDF